MDLNDVERETLKFLYKEYLKDSNLLYNIEPVAAAYGSSAADLGGQLRERRLIKDDAEDPGNGEFRCAISIQGIQEVDPSFVATGIKKLLTGMGRAGRISNVMEILGLGQPGFQQAFDIANEMQNRDLLKLLYAFYAGSKVNVEMTLEGERLVMNE